MKMRTTLFMLLTLMPALALAAGVEVYLNGVQITGAREQVIENARVELDKAGNVHINAPDYKVRELGVDGGNPAATPAPPRLSKKYFVVTEVARPKSTGYEIQVMVNNRLLTTLTDELPQFVLELSDKLQVGTNSVSFRALRPAQKVTTTGQASDTFNVVLGEGHGEEGGTLTIEKVLGEFQVNAADQAEKAQTFTFSAR